MNIRSDQDIQVTLEFALAMSRAENDVDVREALHEIGDVTDTLLRRFGAADCADSAYRAIADFAIREARDLRNIRRDLGLKHFTQRERDLLQNHPKGNELVCRMAEGDEAAVALAGELLVEIKRVRAQLGFGVS